MYKFILFLFSIAFLAQDMDAKTKSYHYTSKRNRGNDINSVMESNLIQFADAEKLNIKLTTIPRYTYFFNTGFEINFKADDHIKLFTGLNVKNVGFIHKINDSSRTKHRVYTFGAPFGFKIHSLNNKVVFKTGVDVSIAFNYKWKNCINDKKTKYNEWFSNRTSLFFPSLFAGIAIHGVSVSANYYLNNFFNPLIPQVKDMEARLFTIGLGLNIDKKMKMNKAKKDSSTTE